MHTRHKANHLNLLTGKRLALRDVKLKDRTALIDWHHPQHDWHKFNGPYYPPTPAEQLPEAVDRWIASDVTGLRRRLLIVQNETDAIIGMVSRYWISEETNWTAIGIVIFDVSNWSKGFGYEALGMWCDYLFTSNPDFVRLDMRTWSGNIGMIKLSKKLGFVREATFRKARIVDGDYYDGLGFGILREEWDARYPNGFGESS